MNVPVDDTDIFTYTAEELTDRLSELDIVPQLILNLSVKPDPIDRLLLDTFPTASVINNTQTSEQSGKPSDRIVTRKLRPDRLDILEESVDLVVINLPDARYDLSTVIAECRRVLRHSGILMFVVIGSDSSLISNLRLPIIGAYEIISIGDELSNHGYAKSVFDAERKGYKKAELVDIYRELEECGCLQCASSSEDNFLSLVQQVEGNELPNSASLTLELIFGIAWNDAESPQSVDVQFH